jgi:drug/metabolite transporter (DMT)-like permease
MLELRRGDAMTLTPRLVLMLCVPPLMWAGNAVVGRLLVGHAPPLALNALRWALALLLLLPFGWRLLRHPGEVWARRGHLALLGLVGVGSYNALQYMAVQTSTPINITLIAASLPVWMLAIGAVFHDVRPRAPQLLGAALSIAGVALVLSRGSLATLRSVSLVPGDLLMLLAIASWAIYSWMLARPPASMRPPERPAWGWAEFLLVQVIFGLAWASLAAGAEAALQPAPVRWSAGVVAAIAFVAIGPSIVAYYCWGKAVAQAGPATAAFFGNLTPVFAALLSAGLLGQTPQWYHAGAFVLIAAGIVVTSRSS